MNKTTKTILYATLGLGGAVGFYFLTKAIVKGVQKRNEEKAQAKLKESLDNETGNSEIEEEQAQQYNPASDLKTFEDKVLGANFLYYPKEINSLINSKTNAELRILNTAFKNKHKESLWSALDDEADGCGSFFGSGFSNCYEAPMNRLSSLGLR